MRIVKDIPQDNSGLQIKARITDAYARPAVDDSASELEQLARSLVNVQPSIMKYLDTKAEEKKDFDTNRGAALYNMLGENMPWEEAKKKLQNGDITGFKDINQNVKAEDISENATKRLECDSWPTCRTGRIRASEPIRTAIKLP